MTNKHKKKQKRKSKQQQEETVADNSQRRTIRHNVAANQEKHRLDWQPLIPDEDGFVADRRIMPLDEKVRREGLHGRATVLAGLSGVGKSSLLNAAFPTFQLRTGELSQLKSHEEKHTTTQAVLLNLPTGGAVIDTPGIKDMGLSGLHPEDLITYYPDVEAIEACKFADCTHSREPGCRVKEAVANGRLTEWRLANYVNLYNKLVDES